MPMPAHTMAAAALFVHHSEFRILKVSADFSEEEKELFRCEVKRFPKPQKHFDRRDLDDGDSTGCHCIFKGANLFPPQDETGSSDIQEVWGCGALLRIPQQLSS